MAANKCETCEHWPAKVERLKLEPGEVVVLFYPRPLSDRARQNVFDSWRRFMPDTKAIVLDDGMTLSTIRATGTMID